MVSAYAKKFSGLASHLDGAKKKSSSKGGPGFDQYGLPILQTPDIQSAFLSGLGASMNSMPGLNDYSNLINPVNFGGAFGVGGAAPAQGNGGHYNTFGLGGYGYTAPTMPAGGSAGGAGGAGGTPVMPPNIDIGFTPAPVWSPDQTTQAVQGASTMPATGSMMGNIGGTLGDMLQGYANTNMVGMAGQAAQANANQLRESQAAAGQAGNQGAAAMAKMYGINQNFNQGYQNALLQLLSSMMGGF